MTGKTFTPLKPFLPKAQEKKKKIGLFFAVPMFSTAFICHVALRRTVLGTVFSEKSLKIKK